MNDELRITNDECLSGDFYSSFVIRHSSLVTPARCLPRFFHRRHDEHQESKRLRWVVALGFLYLVLAVACSPDMRNQPKYKPLTESEFFADGRSERPAVADTVAHGQLKLDERYYQGKVNGAVVGTIPAPVTRQLLERGKERFNIHCTPCHGYLGDGEGIIVKRGYRHPPSYHIDRLRQAPDGHFFDVITNGFGAMPSYASRVAPADRWAITAYIRALQLSQAAKPEDVPPAERRQLLGNTK